MGRPTRTKGRKHSTSHRGIRDSFTTSIRRSSGFTRERTACAKPAMRRSPTPGWTWCPMPVSVSRVRRKKTVRNVDLARRPEKGFLPLRNRRVNRPVRSGVQMDGASPLRCRRRGRSGRSSGPVHAPPESGRRIRHLPKLRCAVHLPFMGSGGHSCHRNPPPSGESPCGKAGAQPHSGRRRRQSDRSNPFRPGGRLHRYRLARTALAGVQSGRYGCGDRCGALSPPVAPAGRSN